MLILARREPNPQYKNGCCSVRNPCPKHRIVAHRYRVGSRFVFDLNSERLDELHRLAQHRYGDTLPDNDEGERFVFVMAHHIGEPNRVREFLDNIAPWYDEDDADRLIKSVAQKCLRWKTDTLASPKWLNVSYAERQRLGLRTIGAFDMPKKERAALRRGNARERRRELKRRRRRANGMRPRVQYETESLSRTKPWETAGVSRATWYRRRETSVGPPILSSRHGDRLVSHAVPAAPPQTRGQGDVAFIVIHSDRAATSAERAAMRARS
jgi:hypothetical protein